MESGFLAIFLTGGTRIVVWLYRLLVFRFLFLAGVVKLVSGDATWRSLTALQYHFWTQPLPTPLAWYAAQAPDWLLSALTGLTLVVELAVVFLIFLPRRPRAIAGILAMAFQLAIIATGNYNFFNLLAMLLVPVPVRRPAAPPHPRPGARGAHQGEGAAAGAHRGRAGNASLPSSPCRWG